MSPVELLKHTEMAIGPDVYAQVHMALPPMATGLPALTPHAYPICTRSTSS